MRFAERELPGIFGRPKEVNSSSERREQRVNEQLGSVLSARKNVLKDHKERSEREHLFLEGTFREMIAERNKRADDLDSPEVQESITIINQLMPYPTYGMLCMDGRVTRTLMFGFPLGTDGGFIRLPAGDPQEFAPARGGGVVLRRDSYVADALDRAGQNGTNIVEILDSHVGCAARNRIEESQSEERSDHGLLQDVKRKKKIADALQNHRSSSDTITPIQTSFDPSTGYLYMGLEKENVLAQAEENGFISELRDHLSDRDEIIYTGKLVEDPMISRLFEEHQIEGFDWENNYKDTTSAFWKNMENMVSENGLTQHIRETYVDRLFPEAGEKELQERTMLLAANAYNAYSLNKEGEYPFAQHKEWCIVISEGESSPLGETPSFSLFSDSTAMYDEYIRLADSLIRSNRKAGRVTDHTGQYQDRSIEDFARAPVPVLHQSIIRDEGVDWSQVRLLASQPDAIPENWYEMSSEEFAHHLGTIDMQIPSENVIKAMDQLRKEMAIVYRPEGNTDEAVFAGKVEIISALVDSKRRIQAIVPFVHKGHSLAANN